MAHRHNDEDVILGNSPFSVVSVIMDTVKRSGTMDHKHTLTELNNCSREELITMVLSMQGQLDMLNQNIEKLIEQVRLANSYRFGKHTETLKSIDGQLSLF